MSCVRLCWPMSDSDLDAVSGELLDATDSALLWGERMRGRPVRWAVRVGRSALLALSAPHAEDLIGAELLQYASALGTERLEHVTVEGAAHMKPHQLSGSLSALRAAQQDGLVTEFSTDTEGL